MSHKRRLGALLSVVLTLSLASFGYGQTPQKVPRIGYLSAVSPAYAAPLLKAFRQRLQTLGYVEGENFIIEDRHANSRFDRIPALAAELVGLEVDVIVTAGGMDTRAVKNATNTIPIVMAQDPDPVASGFVVSLARPGRNITGSAGFGPEIAGKHVGLLKQAIPTISRLAVFGFPSNPITTVALREVERTAKAHGVTVQYVAVINPKKIDEAFRIAKHGLAEAVLILPGPFNPLVKQIADLALESQLPTISIRPQFANAGGLMSYGPDNKELYRQAATYVDQILRGAKPGQLPVKQPTKFEFVINLKTAKALGLKLPQSVLLQASELIE